MAMPDLSFNPFFPSELIEGGWCLVCNRYHLMREWCPRNTTPTIEWDHKESITSDPPTVGETWTSEPITFTTSNMCPYCGGEHGSHTRTDCPFVTRHEWTDPDMGWRCPNCGRGNAPYMKYCDCHLNRYHMIWS